MNMRLNQLFYRTEAAEIATIDNRGEKDLEMESETIGRSANGSGGGGGVTRY